MRLFQTKPNPNVIPADADTTNQWRRVSFGEVIAMFAGTHPAQHPHPAARPKAEPVGQGEKSQSEIARELAAVLRPHLETHELDTEDAQQSIEAWIDRRDRRRAFEVNRRRLEQRQRERGTLRESLRPGSAKPLVESEQADAEAPDEPATAPGAADESPEDPMERQWQRQQDKIRNQLRKMAEEGHPEMYERPEIDDGSIMELGSPLEEEDEIAAGDYDADGS